MTQPMITPPLGWLAGHPVALDAALQNLSTEILAHAADLEAKPETANQAAPLRRYGWALWLIWLQLQPPEQKGGVMVNRAALAELAAEYKLTLPGDLQGE